MMQFTLSGGHDDDEPQIHDDIGNFVPLGSLSIIQRGLTIPQNWHEPHNELQHILLPSEAHAHVSSLLKSRWVRVFTRQHKVYENVATVRIYILPNDVGGSYDFNRADRNLRRNLIGLVACLDCSWESWIGQNMTLHSGQRYQFETASNDSLFYLFNTLPSPSPSPTSISSIVARNAVDSLLDISRNLPGLTTSLYPYQKRSAAMMIQRETEPLRTLDPRLTCMQGPTGHDFYYNKETGDLFRDKQLYEEARGGILAEVR